MHVLCRHLYYSVLIQMLKKMSKSIKVISYRKREMPYGNRKTFGDLLVHCGHDTVPAYSHLTIGRSKHVVCCSPICDVIGVSTLTSGLEPAVECPATLNSHFGLLSVPLNRWRILCTLKRHLTSREREPASRYWMLLAIICLPISCPCSCLSLYIS